MHVKSFSRITLFVFILFGSNLLMAQSKMEYGLGIAINHSKINEQILTSVGNSDDHYGGMRLPSVFTRIGYKFSKQFHLNSGLGFSWIGSLHKNLDQRIVASTFEIPLQLEWNPSQSFHLASGGIYNYAYGLNNETESTKTDILPLANSKHQFGFKQTVSYSYEALEFMLSFNHYVTDILLMPVIDQNGNEIGTLSSKFSNIQFGIIFRR